MFSSVLGCVPPDTEALTRVKLFTCKVVSGSTHGREDGDREGTATSRVCLSNLLPLSATEAQSCWGALGASVDQAPPQGCPPLDHRVKAVSRGYLSSVTLSLLCGWQNGLWHPEKAGR